MMEDLDVHDEMIAAGFEAVEIPNETFGNTEEGWKDYVSAFRLKGSQWCMLDEDGIDHGGIYLMSKELDRPNAGIVRNSQINYKRGRTWNYFREIGGDVKSWWRATEGPSDHTFKDLGEDLAFSVCHVCGDTTGKVHCCALDSDGTRNKNECLCFECAKDMMFEAIDSYDRSKSKNAFDVDKMIVMRRHTLERLMNIFKCVDSMFASEGEGNHGDAAEWKRHLLIERDRCIDSEIDLVLSRLLKRTKGER
jgi:hypothetical protein